MSSYNVPAGGMSPAQAQIVAARASGRVTDPSPLFSRDSMEIMFNGFSYIVLFGGIACAVIMIRNAMKASEADSKWYNPLTWPAFRSVFGTW